jgi:FtsP/CotA-like multicopper oxidase with cupredoxin domain
VATRTWTSVATLVAVCALTSTGRMAQAPAPPLAVVNDNTIPAGRMEAGVATIHLETAIVRWQPEEAEGPTRVVEVFGEEGKTPSVPGPLIRVAEGADLHVTVRNRLAVAMRLHGMMSRPGDPATSVEIAPGATADIRFKAGKPGTYFYWAETDGTTYALRRGIDSQLNGAFVVDPPRGENVADERIFLISEWLQLGQGDEEDKFNAVINGRGWPHTERLTLPFGAPATWHVINASFSPHPMHLHGTFYTVESRGDAGRDTIYGTDGRRLVTTELMEPGTTMMMRWVPDRVGKWLFHCHIQAHVSGEMRLGDMTPAEREHAKMHMEHDIEHAMAGLVLGLTVTGGDETAAPDLQRYTPRPYTIEMVQRAHQYGDEDGFGFRILELGSSAKNEPPDAPATSPTLVLTRGQPVMIDLVNHLKSDTQIHWHGIELESFNDGVAGWSGAFSQVTPMVPAGETYRVRFTPPRAGTFIYHTHAHDPAQLAGGLYGALIVVEPGKTLDPDTDRVVLLGGGGPAIEVNRSTNPAAWDLKMGVKYRLRFIDITPNFTAIVSLRGDAGLVPWRAVAKDGADLPPTQATRRRVSP